MVDLGLSVRQLKNAQIIVAVGKADGFDDADIATAVMTAITESGLQNYANENNPASLALPHDAVGSDHGSVGIFQQQVGGAANSTANWGTTAELMDPATAAQKFYAAMRQKFPHGTTGTSPWMVAQSVQGSAYSDGSNYQKNWVQAVTIEGALFATSNSVPHIAKPGPWPVNSLKAPLPDATRNKLITWIVNSGPPWKNDPGNKRQIAALQADTDNDLIATYNQLAGGYSVQGGDPGQAIPGEGPVPGLPGWLDSLKKLLAWITDVHNWERIGLFALGAILLILVFVKLFSGSSTVASVVKVVAA